MSMYELHIRNREWTKVTCSGPMPELHGMTVYAIIDAHSAVKIDSFDDVGGVKSNGWRLPYPIDLLVERKISE